MTAWLVVNHRGLILSSLCTALLTYHRCQNIWQSGSFVFYSLVCSFHIHFDKFFHWMRKLDELQVHNRQDSYIWPYLVYQSRILVPFGRLLDYRDLALSILEQIIISFKNVFYITLIIKYNKKDSTEENACFLPALHLPW